MNRKKIIKKWNRIKNWRIRRKKKLFYEGNEYLVAYSKHTDFRVSIDYKRAVGGLWEEVGKLQFSFLVTKGLQPKNTILDIGCGTLRGGRHFIRYLDAQNYYGIDISKKAIEYANNLVKNESLIEKKPILLVSKNMKLTFEEFKGIKFDYILAHSVFTHLMPEHIKECFVNIKQIMNSNSILYFTFNKGEKFAQTSNKDFWYPLDFFKSLANENRYRFYDCSSEYHHPRDQYMAAITK